MQEADFFLNSRGLKEKAAKRSNQRNRKGFHLSVMGDLWRGFPGMLEKTQPVC
jgi:hypothetical protein